MDETQQYLRACTLLVVDQTTVVGASNPALDLSQLRIKFSVKRSDTMTPNVADIRVYNVEAQTAFKIRSLVNLGKVILQAGYQGNYGVIFQGNIKQVILGRESGTDTYIDILAGDGDRAYNFAIINSTLAAGSTQMDQVNAAVSSMTPKGVTAGNVAIISPSQLPRGKVMYGNAKNYLRSVAKTTQYTWSIQDEKVTFVPKKSYLPGTAVILNSQTGMIGAPQQTNEGVNVKCLLNPNIKISGRVQINEDLIQRLKINLSIPNTAANIPAPINADGVYYVLVAEHTGDTRGVDWYTSLICLNISVTSNPLNSVQV